MYKSIKAFIKKNIKTEYWEELSKLKKKKREFERYLGHLKIKYRLYFKYFGIKPKHYLSVVAIIKNEGEYILEWIEYHRIMGVSKFYIYDNESDDNINEILKPYIEEGIVDYKYCPGNGKQTWAYNDVLEKARKETCWLALIDCDEFIVPTSTTSIIQLLEELEGYGGLGINWLFYGSSGQKEKTSGLVIERFKDHSNLDFHKNEHIKTILNPRYALHTRSHDASYVLGKFCVNSSKEKIEGKFNYNLTFDKVRLNHYFGKSYEEFLEKRMKGYAARPNGIRPMEDFYTHDRNEIKNDKIMDKYIPEVYARIKKLKVNLDK